MSKQTGLQDLSERGSVVECGACGHAVVIDSDYVSILTQPVSEGTLEHLPDGGHMFIGSTKGGRNLNEVTLERDLNAPVHGCVGSIDNDPRCSICWPR